MNINRLLLAGSLALLAVLNGAAAARAQSLLKVDFGVGPALNTVQPGFTAVIGEVVADAHFENIGPYSLMLTGNGFFSAGNAGNIGESVRPLYRDYYYNNTPGPDDGIELSLGGFAPSTEYNLTLWSFDADNMPGVGSSTETTWTPYNGTTGPVGNITNFAEPPYPNPTTLNQFNATIAVTSSPSGSIDVFGTTISGGGGTRLNGARVSSGATDLLSLDFGRTDAAVSPVQTGHVGVFSDVGAANFTQTVGAYAITLQGQGFFQTTSANADLIDAGVRDYYRDYYYNNAIDPGIGVTLKIDGVTPNKDYDLTLWSYDADNFSPTPTIWEPQGSTTGPVGNVTNQQDPYPTATTEYSTTIRVRSTTNTLEIKGSTTGGTGGTRLNGFELLAAGLAADFDSSTAVNAADFGIWKGGFGTATGAAKTNGDADNDQDVDGHDFLTWQREFGSSQSIAAVPEPCTFTGAAIAGLFAVTSRRRQRVSSVSPSRRVKR